MESRTGRSKQRESLSLDIFFFANLEPRGSSCVSPAPARLRPEFRVHLRPYFAIHQIPSLSIAQLDQSPCRPRPTDTVSPI